MKTYLLNPGVRQEIAKAGETGVAVAYNAAEWINDYPSGVPQLMVTRPNGQRLPVTVTVTDNLIAGQVPDELLVNPGMYSYVFVWTSGSTQLTSGPCECIVLGSDLAKTWADVRRAPDWAERIFLAAGVIESSFDGAVEIRNETVDAMNRAEDARTAAETAQEAAEDAQEAAESAADRAEYVKDNIPLDYSELSADVVDLDSTITAITDHTNLFDKNDATEGVRLAPSGVEYSDSDYFTSDYIPVTPGEAYTKNSPVANAYHRAALYNASKTGVRTIDDSNAIIPQTGEAYVRFCGLLTEIDTAALKLVTAVDSIARSSLSTLSNAAESSFDGSDVPNIVHGVKDLASGVDLNTVNESGLYGLMGVANRYPNAPESLVSGIMYVIKDKMQIVHNVFKGMPTEYARYKTVSGWSAWGRANLTRSDITAMCPNWINWTNIDTFGKTAGLQTASGIVSGTGYYHVTLAINVSKRIKTVWTNSAYDTPVIYELADGTLTAITTYTAEGNSFGKRFAIPSNAAKIHLNFRLTSDYNAGYFEEGVHDDYPDTFADMYCFEYTYGQKLNGKKVLCISDSMGYTDSRAIVQGRYHCYCAIGYPTWIRSTGAHVDVAGGGYSGKAFANNSEADSIYKKIVTEQFDVSGYDVIMLVASGNDWRLQTTIGDAGNNTGVPNTDPDTMCGAIGAILAYIYENNPFCKVYMCPPPQKRMVQDSMSVAKSYVDAQLDVAEYWGLPIINLWNSGIAGPTSGNYAELLYDLTHPNYFGAKMLGETIVNGLHGV